MTHDEMIEVLAAHRDGKDIEWRRLPGTYNDGTPKNWGVFASRGLCGGSVWDFTTHEYRIKPEPKKPREWTLSAGNAMCIFALEGPSIEIREHVRVREVLE